MPTVYPVLILAAAVGFLSACSTEMDATKFAINTSAPITDLDRNDFFLPDYK